MAEIEFYPDLNNTTGDLIYLGPEDTCSWFPWASEPSSAGEHTFVAYPPRLKPSIADWYLRVGDIVRWCRDHGVGDPYIRNAPPHNAGNPELPVAVATMQGDKAMLFKLTFGGAG